MMNYSFGNQVITVSTFQGNPPFEKPSIAKGVTNFVLFKFGHLPQKDWQTMYDLAKMFLHCLNHWKLETPTARKQLMSSDDISAYKVSVYKYCPQKSVTRSNFSCKMNTEVPFRFGRAMPGQAKAELLF